MNFLNEISLLRKSFHEGNECLILQKVRQVGLQYGRNVDTCLSLVILQDAAHRTRSGAQRRVQCVHVLAFSASDRAQSPSKVVRAVCR